VATVPDKRNVSKQRRAARNRASRDSLAARRENAVITPASSTTRTTKAAPASRASSRGSSRAAPRATGRDAARPARPIPVAVGPAPQGFKEMLQSRRPGDRALVVAFGLAILSALFSLLVVKVDVDDRGEPLPLSYRALTLMAREAAGHSGTIESESMISAYGPIIVLVLLTPVLITAYALWVNRRVDRARVLTFVLIAMAVATMLSGAGSTLVQAVLSFGALIALGVGVFRIRKADTEAGMAAAPPPGAGGAPGDVIDAETTDSRPAAPTSLLQRLLGAGPAAGGGRGARTPEDDVADDDVADDDPLAELEAELAAEAEAEGGSQTEGGSQADSSETDSSESDASGGDDASSGNGRGRRRR